MEPSQAASILLSEDVATVMLDYVRDGSVSLPSAYTPTTYDNRPASTEEQELLEAAMPELKAVLVHGETRPDEGAHARRGRGRGRG